MAATLIVATVGAAWAVPAVKALGLGEEPTSVATARYVVRPGDTLWSIAEQVSPGEDPRPVVDLLTSANDLDPGTLVPGQTLIVPTGV